MPFPRFYKLDYDKKKLILRTALEEFAYRDYNQASLNKISKKAGLSSGNLYYYFENKEDLYETVVEFVKKSLWSEIGDLEKNTISTDFWAGIREIVSIRLKLSSKDPALGYMINKLYEFDDSKTTSDIELKAKQQMRNDFKKIFEMGIAAGEIRTDLPADYLFHIHLNFTLTTNQWITRNLAIYNKDTVDSGEMDQFLDTAIGMIKSMMQPT